MPLDPTQNQKIDELITSLKNKEQEFSDATDANDAAQTAAQSAVATAAGTLAAKSGAHDDLSASIDALITFVQTLK